MDEIELVWHGVHAILVAPLDLPDEVAAELESHAKEEGALSFEWLSPIRARDLAKRLYVAAGNVENK